MSVAPKPAALSAALAPLARAKRICALLSALIGAVVLVGWLLDLPTIKSVLPGLTTMKANTALGLLAAGAGLALLPDYNDAARDLAQARAAFVAGWIALLLGILTAGEYVTGVPLGIDEALFADSGTTSPPYPGRMAPATAIGLAACGSAILLLLRARREPQASGQQSGLIAHLLAIVPAGIGYLGFAGYAYDVEGLYSFGSFARVALHTNIAFVLLAFAIVATSPRLGWERRFEGWPVSRQVFTRLLPGALLIPFVAGAIVVWGARRHIYDPLYGPALFALTAAGSAIFLAWYSAGVVRRAEVRLSETIAALRESELRLRVSQEAAQIGTWDWDIATGGIHWTDQQFRLYGLDPAKARPPNYETWSTAIHAEDRDRTQALVMAAVAGEALFETEYRIQLPDDRGVRWLYARGEVSRAQSGAPTRMLGINLDVTDRKRSETSLAESEARFHAITDAMPQIVWTARPDGFHDYFNQRWYDITGTTLEQVNGEGWKPLFHPDDRARARSRWRHSLESGEPYEIEYRLRTADGGYRWMLARALPLRNDAGLILRWFGTGTDIEDSVAARDAIARMAKDLETQVAERTRALSDAARELAAEMQRRAEAQAALLQSRKLEALGQLVGGVAHDFNNVLAAIIGSFALIRRRVEVPEVLEIVTHGEVATDRATRLIRQLLAFARKEELRPTLLDLEAVLHSAEDLICHSIGKKIECVLELSDSTWPVLGDKHQLEIALLNLAVNARDAMPDGGRLTISARNLSPAECLAELPTRDYVAVAVADTGTGMPADVLARATDPFFTTKPQGQGTGLGLSMVHGFAKQSGGGLRISSQLGLGTTIEILLPRADLIGAVAGTPSGLQTALDATLHGDATILMVDDDEQVRPMTVGLLRDLGYHVVEAANAETALVLVQTVEQLDLVITDVVMPGADGPTLAQRLRAEFPRVPVLFVTGHAVTGAFAEAALLRKPFSGAELAAAVLERLGRRAPRPEPLPPTDRLLARIRRPALRELYIAWSAARTADALPRLGRIDPARFGLGDSAFTIVVEAAAEQTRFRLIAIGEHLSARLGCPPEGDVITVDTASEQVLGSLGAAYRRCARQRMPVYEAARYEFGDGDSVDFERLVMPFAADGQAITHLVGVALFEGPTF